MLPVVERSGLWVTDIEILRLHYAETLQAWRERFLATAPSASKRSMTSASAACGSSIWLAREVALPPPGPHQFPDAAGQALDAVPLTRDYMSDREREHAPSGSKERAA